MKPPVQLWLPLLACDLLEGASYRDLQRAQAEWRGENRIWLLPHMKRGPVRWSRSVNPYVFNEAAISSEALNIIDIVHVDDEGNCFPPGDAIPEKWDGKVPADLLQNWLNAKFFITKGRPSITLPLPVFNGKSSNVSYRNRRIELEAGPKVPVEILSSGRLSVQVKNPKGIALINPAEEIQHITGNADQKKFLNVWVRGEPPFDHLFPYGIHFNDIVRQSIMQRIAIDNNLALAKEWAQKTTIEASSNLEMSELAPACEAGGSEKALNIASGIYERRKIPVQFGELGSLAQLRKREDYQSIFLSPTRIRRCFGWQGYFWWELSRSLEMKEAATCKRCGGLFFGKRGKAFCSSEDSLVCYRERRAADVRRHRQKPSRVH